MAFYSSAKYVFFAFLFLCSTQLQANDFKPFYEQSELGKIDWDEGMIYGVGKGYLKHNRHSKIHALRAARALAFQSIVKLAATVKVNDRNTITVFVSGYEEVGNRSVDGSNPYIEITYRVPLHGVNGVGAKLLEKVGMVQKGDDFTLAEAEDEVWLVLDAREVSGKQVSPALFPKIVSATETLYQVDKSLDKASLVTRGMASYVSTNERLEGAAPGDKSAWIEHILSIVVADAHAGERKKRRRYIVKKVEDIKGLYNTNLVVSEADAKSIKAANNSSGILQKTRVVVVVSSAIGGIEGALEYQFGLR